MEKLDRQELVRKAIAEGLIKNDPHWLDSLEEPLPAWAVLELMLAILEKLNPSDGSYD